MHVGGNAAPVSGGQMAPAEIIMMATLDSPTSSMMTSESGPPRSAKPCPLRLADHIADGPHFNARTKIGGEEPIELNEMGAVRRSVRRRSEEHKTELQSLMSSTSAALCLNKNINTSNTQ